MKSITSAIFLFFLLSICCVFDANAKQELTISAAASLAESFTEIGKEFELRHPEIKINFNFAASGPLLQQISQGAPVDVFASADVATMEKAKKNDLIIPETYYEFAGNTLVLIEPIKAGNIKDINGLSADNIKKIAIGTPESVPVGNYTKKMLESKGLWEKLKDKYVFALSVKQALEYVQRAEVDAGFVYKTDAMTRKDKVKIVESYTLSEKVLYPIAIIKTSEKKEAAKKFIDFLKGDISLKIFEKYGFIKP